MSEAAPDLVIRGGNVVTPQGAMDADIAIGGEYISAVGAGLRKGKSEIDATGLTILPGLIDIHLHFNEPGRADWEGAATGSRALAAGGGALFFDMPLNSSPCTTNARNFDLKRAALEAASITDFALWGGLVPGNSGELAELADRGVVGFKAFLCDSGLAEFPRADDLTLYEGIKEAARLGLPVAVHAESEEITTRLARRIIDSGRHDYLGVFALTTGLGVDEIAREFEKDHDDYNAIMTKALADRLAEAAAEWLHRQARIAWGFGQNENLSNDDLIKEQYRGIRPAPGYPAQPDHTEKRLLFDLLQAEKNAHVILTENFAMHPASAVSGLYFAHPEAKYFGVGMIARDQVEDYARRKAMDLPTMEKWLAPNLSYDPEKIAPTPTAKPAPGAGSNCGCGTQHP